MSYSQKLLQGGLYRRLYRGLLKRDIKGDTRNTRNYKGLYRGLLKRDIKGDTRNTRNYKGLYRGLLKRDIKGATRNTRSLEYGSCKVEADMC